MKVLVPAKINTLLYLLHKREDGYHELYSHFVPISLYDSLEIIPQNQSGITLEVDGMDFEEGLQNNLVFHAAELFQEHTSNPFGMSIILKKNIPVGAGLGGGSADAAATLHVLNQLHQNPFSRKELQDLALNLGADVPFFIDPEPSEVRGIGDVIRPLNHYPLLPLLILKPSFSISTAEAFQECIPRRMKVPMKIVNDEELARNLENRFEYTLFKKYPELKELKNQCLEHGALGASVSGSGSALFALFRTESEQMEAARKLKRISLTEIFPCKMLKKHIYDGL